LKKKSNYFENKHNSPQKTLGTRREVINAGTLPWNVFIAAQEN